MSFKAMAWATEQEITQTSPQSHLLLILANYANELNECYPSITTLSNKTRLNEKTVRKCLKELVDLGLIFDTQKQSHFGSKIYVLAVSETTNTPTKFGTPAENGTPTKFGTTPLPNLPSTPTKFGTTPLPNLVPNPINKPIKEPIKEPINNKPKKFDPCQIDLPQSVDKELWIAFVKMRRAIKKPITEEGIKWVIEDLVSFGDLANQSLKYSIKNSYAGLFLPKTDAQKTTKGDTANAEYWEKRSKGETIDPIIAKIKGEQTW